MPAARAGWRPAFARTAKTFAIKTSLSRPSLFRVEAPRRRRRPRCAGIGGLQRISEPQGPAFRPVRRGELLVGSDAHITIEVAHGDGVAELRAGARNARLEAAHPVSGAAVAARLVIEVAHQADLQLLGQVTRRAPVQMDID